MKNFKASLIVLFITLFANAINAQQKHTVIIDKKTVKTVNNIGVKIKFDIDQVTTPAQVEALRAKLAAGKDVHKVIASAITGNKATFVISYPKAEFNVQKLQDNFTAAGLTDLLINNEAVKTSDLAQRVGKKQNKK